MRRDGAGRFGRRALGLAVVLAVLGCAGMDGQRSGPAPLRIGVTTNYPPMIFRSDGQITGLEADLARQLGWEMQRAIQFVEVRWEDQIPTLQAGKTDIIMSGMSVTDARQIRIAFAEPYFRGGLLAAMRTEDRGRYTTREELLAAPAAVGVVEGTTGDVFVQRNMPNARRIAVSRASDGALALKRHTVDLFVHDAPAIVWLISANEADLTALRVFLNREDLAWGLRRTDPELLATVNAALQKWKADGTLDQLLGRWLPAAPR
jgi:polar amino acid transport system substrate-binding protein